MILSEYLTKLEFLLSPVIVINHDITIFNEEIVYM